MSLCYGHGESKIWVLSKTFRIQGSCKAGSNGVQVGFSANFSLPKIGRSGRWQAVREKRKGEPNGEMCSDSSMT